MSVSDADRQRRRLREVRVAAESDRLRRVAHREGATEARHPNVIPEVSP